MNKQTVSLQSDEFQPKNEYVLVKPEAQAVEKTTDSGIVIPTPRSSSLDRPSSGVVVAVGSDIEDISEDDFVLWPDTDGIDLELTDGDYTLIRYKSIIGSKK